MLDIRRRDEGGFTLIELLVVIIIIGILAAIAIPVYLSQRTKAWDSASRSDLRSAAASEDGYIVDQGSFGSIAAIVAAGGRITVSRGVTLTLVNYDTAKGYCWSAKHTSSTHTFFYDSNAGGLLPSSATGCPVITSGTAGGSISG